MKRISYIIVCLIFTGVSLIFAQVSNSSDQLITRTIEDGGTGVYKAIMYTDSSLSTHTIFRPNELSIFTGKNKLPVIAWGNGACANSPAGHVNFLSEVASHGFLVIKRRQGSRKAVYR